MVYVSPVKQAIIFHAQKELESPLMLVLLSLKLSYKFKTWLHQRWFVVLAYSEICSSIPSSSDIYSCIFMVYSDGVESRRKMRSNQNIHDPTWRHIIWNWEWFQGMCCRKIWGICACTVMQIFMSMYSLPE